MIPPERHARRYAPMIGAGGDETREGVVAAGPGIDAGTLKAPEAGSTVEMCAADGMAVETPAHSGAPCSLERFATIHAEMGCRKDPQGDPIHYLLVLAEHGMAQPRWLQCEGYWMPRVGADTILGAPNPQFDPVQALRFRALLRQASDRIHHTAD